MSLVSPKTRGALYKSTFATILYSKHKQVAAETLKNKLSETIMHAQVRSRSFDRRGIRSRKSTPAPYPKNPKRHAGISKSYSTGHSIVPSSCPKRRETCNEYWREAARPVHAGP
ncbi:hypothetical protein IFM46972_01694 [Aspergillus udagawae]|uniref:Uncharacterized protein n=1 Tax=Aspergillus udagawae TaxID=91492 RepID=A0A8H3RNF0_9EURO|nr:hypothetical protein IFM46972_01694 [Aspergillus udagawae]